MSLKLPEPEPFILADTAFHDSEEWRLKYYEDMELQEKEQMQLRRELDEVRDNEQLLTIEVEELHKELKYLLRWIQFQFGISELYGSVLTIAFFRVSNMQLQGQLFTC